jgi:hypothetical protein
VGLQIVPVLAKPTEFTGYSTTACNSAFAWVGKKIDKEHAAKQAIDSMTPTSVIMSGVVKDGVLQFTVTKSIGTPSGGCPLTAFTITPYAGTQVAAEWKAGTCDGGQMILNRV